MPKKIAYKDLSEIEKFFKSESDNNKYKAGLALIDEAYFLGETLRKLKNEVSAEGVVTEMCQGDYSIKRENPALRSYNTCVKNYQNIIKQITDLLPKEQSGNAPDDFDEFGEDV